MSTASYSDGWFFFSEGKGKAVEISPEFSIIKGM